MGPRAQGGWCASNSNLRLDVSLTQKAAKANRAAGFRSAALCLRRAIVVYQFSISASVRPSGSVAPVKVQYMVSVCVAVAALSPQTNSKDEGSTGMR